MRNRRSSHGEDWNEPGLYHPQRTIALVAQSFKGIRAHFHHLTSLMHPFTLEWRPRAFRGISDELDFHVHCTQEHEHIHGEPARNSSIRRFVQKSRMMI